MQQAIINYLQSKNFKFEIFEDKNITIFGIETTKSKYKCIFDLKEKESVLVFYSVIQNFDVPEHKRNDLAILLTKINYGLIIGNFEMDFSDGELRYKTSIDFEGVELVLPLIDNLFNANLAYIEYFYDQLYHASLSE